MKSCDASIRNKAFDISSDESRGAYKRVVKKIKQKLFILYRGFTPVDMVTLSRDE